MVKLWGYNESCGNEKTCPSSMFEAQRLRKVSNSSSGSVKKVIMKLPKVYDIQRSILARHLMYLRYPQVRHGKLKSPITFEAELAEFRKQAIGVRATSISGGKRREIRKKREEEGASPEITSEDGLTQQQKQVSAKWDINGMSHKNISPDIRREAAKIWNRSGKMKTALQIENFEKDECERNCWLPKLTSDMKSDRLNEILAMHRMVTESGASLKFQPIYTIFLESAHYALKTHNWAVICKCLCGMAVHFRKHKYMCDHSMFPGALNIFWMLGFLTLANHFKDDVSEVEQFAKNVHTLLGGNPLWIASHLAVWMIQKGYFMAAHRIIDEYSLSRLRPMNRFQSKHNKSENPKRDMAVFFTHMIESVHLFCIWKKDSTLSAAIEDDDIDTLIDAPSIRMDALRRKGEAALNAFEICYDQYKKIEGDAMCFLQPYIELVVEFRSVQRARDILEEVFNLNDGNIFVEEFYAEFLDEHYAEHEPDLIHFLKGRTERKFKYREEDVKTRKKKGKRQIKQWKEGKRESTTVSTWKKIPKPSFSW